MKSVTRYYLASIIYIVINKNHQHISEPEFDELFADLVAIDEKVLDFVLFIPFFDEGLKNFIIGNLKEESAIITTEWEERFVEICFCWHEINESRSRHLTLDSYLHDQKDIGVLSLPY